MKNIYKLFVALAALSLWACRATVLEPVLDITDSPDTNPVAEEFKIVTIVAGKEQTKTSYAGETDFSWSAGDQVSVIFNDETDSHWVPFTTATAAASCEFTSSPVPSSYKMGSLSGRRLALYPASDSHVYTSDSDISYYMPAERDFRASAGGHPETAIPMFGEGFDNDSYTFHNMTGAVKFTFENVPCSEAKFVFTSAEEKISGFFPLTGLEDHASSVSWAACDAANDAEKKLTLYADVDPVSHSVSFYVPYVGTLPAGCRIELLDAESSMVLFDRSTVSDLVVEKNRITVVPIQDVSSGDPHSPSLVHLDQDVRNPERGFTHPNVLEYNGTTFPSGLYNVDDDNSLVFIRFDLTGYKGGALTSDVLDAIRFVFTDVRNRGKKAVIRFIYSTGNQDDAPLTTVQDHLLQLKDVFAEHQDVIYVVQAGFIGACGEWRQSNYFSFTYPPGQSDEVSGFEDYAEVVDALLDAVPEHRHIALRGAYFKRYYTYTKSLVPSSCWDWNPITAFDGTDYNSRISFHNDAFGHDGGTFVDFGVLGDWNDPKNIDRKMWRSQSPWLVCGGETYTSSPHSLFSQWPRVREDLYDQHISYLGDNRGTSCLSTTLSDAQIEELRKCMGYHLWLKEANVYYSDSDPDALAAGKPLTVFCQLENNGAAPVIYQRPMKLVLLRGDNVTVLADNMGDVRKVASNGGIRSFFAKFTIPAGGIQSGDKLALWLPDASATIADRAVYAIHLANDHDYDDTEWVTSNPSNPNDPSATGGYNVFYTFP